jgi:hypothetical protein
MAWMVWVTWAVRIVGEPSRATIVVVVVALVASVLGVFRTRRARVDPVSFPATGSAAATGMRRGLGAAEYAITAVAGPCPRRSTPSRTRWWRDITALHGESGVGTYTATTTRPDDWVPDAAHGMLLDLGTVDGTASVTVNCGLVGSGNGRARVGCRQAVARREEHGEQPGPDHVAQGGRRTTSGPPPVSRTGCADR